MLAIYSPCQADHITNFDAGKRPQIRDTQEGTQEVHQVKDNRIENWLV